MRPITWMKRLSYVRNMLRDGMAQDSFYMNAPDSFSGAIGLFLDSYR